MSEIPFVNALGDEIERAIAARRGRIRRRIAIGALGFAVAVTGVAAASGVLAPGTPEQLATTGIGCYDRADFDDANVAVLSTGDATPIETCRRLMNVEGPLVACAGEAVLVFPGGPGTCERLGFRPLPPEYIPTRRRVNALAREIEALERSADCLPPEALARRVQRLLDRSPGWDGWRTTVDESMDEGPCGTVTLPGGDGSRSIDGALDTEARLVRVSLGPSRSTIELLLMPDAPGNRLLDASGERCYTAEDLQQLAHDRLDRFGRPLTFETRRHPDDMEVADPRGRRLEEGCAIIVGVAPTPDDRGIVVEIWD